MPLHPEKQHQTPRPRASSKEAAPRGWGLGDKKIGGACSNGTGKDREIQVFGRRNTCLP